MYTAYRPHDQFVAYVNYLLTTMITLDMYIDNPTTWCSRCVMNISSLNVKAHVDTHRRLRTYTWNQLHNALKDRDAQTLFDAYKTVYEVNTSSAYDFLYDQLVDT